MKIVNWNTLVDEGGYTSSPEYAKVRGDVEKAVSGVVWPPGADDFAIYPQSGKKRGEGNGVVPIKAGFAAQIQSLGWKLEKSAPRNPIDIQKAVVKGSQPGAFDAHFTFENNEPQPFVVEWETGNISSSHRAINRIGLGMQTGYISGGVLILPTNALAKYLTDRIGNEPELRPYHPLWKAWTFQQFSYFGIVSIEHDRESLHEPKIPKGKDGRARPELL